MQATSWVESDEYREAAAGLSRRAADYRVTLRNLVDGVNVALESLPPASRRVLEACLCGAHQVAEVVLGR